MKLGDIVFMAVDGIKERKFRVSLNILGILIGIAAIVALLSITQGVSIAINQELELLDPLTIMVMPGSFLGMAGPGGGASEIGRGVTLTLRDIERVERISGVDMATPVITIIVEAHISGHSDSVTVTGMIPEEYTQAFATVEVAQGRLLRGSDGTSTVLGARVAYPQHLEEPIARVGSRVTLNVKGEEKTESVTLRVAGILEEVGGMFASVDTEILITFKTAQRIFHTGNTIDQIIIKAKNIESVNEIIEEVQDEFGEGIMVMSSETIMDMVESVMTMMEAILGGIAAISLVVAGIAVINTMTISVMERTREIGVMKALGAKSRDVLTMFLTESLLTGLIGGVIGVVFGIFLGQIASVMLTFTMNVSLASVTSLEVIIVGIAFAAITGTLSGLYPSRKASKLAPVEALRYE